MSRASGRGLRVVFQGGPGAHGERAITAHWKGRATAVSMRSFPSLVTAVADGTADFGVVPVWNSAIGAVHDGEAALASAGDRVETVDEVLLPVRHALLGAQGATLGTLRAVGSHHVALLQCRRFFVEHPELTPVPAWDTAGSARELATLASGRAPDAWIAPWFAALPRPEPNALGAIAHAELATPLGLTVLADAIQDDPANVTRFLVVQPRRTPWRW